MGSHIDILLQGIWASLTGGWFYDPHQNIFSNTFHLYLWMALLVLPFILHLTLTPTLAIWTIYCAAIGALFALIKYVNCKLHYMFDTSEVIEEPTEKGDKSSGEKGSKIIELVSNENEVEQIEMVSLSNQSTQANAEEEGEGKEENRRQSVHSRGLQRQGCLVIKERRTTQRPDISGPAPLAECEIDEIDQSQGSADKKEDIKEGSVSSLKGAEGGIDETSDKQTSKSNQITTTAEVAINHRESDGEVEPGEVKDLVKLKEETDSDLSPEGGAKIKKRRKAVRRTKSALETTHELNPRKINPGLEDLHSSLPTRLFMREENSEENEGDNVRGGVFRPTRKRSRREKKDNTVLEDMTIVDLEGLNDGRTSPFKQRAPTPHCRKKQLVTESEKKPGRYGRSVSVDERMMPFRPRLLTPDSHSMKKIKKSDLETKPHDVKQCTESPRDQSGNVDLLANIPHSADVTPRSIGSQSETSHVNPREVSVEVRKHDGVKSKPRPSSAGDIKSLFTPFDPKSATANKNGKMKDSHISSRIAKFLQNGTSNDKPDVPSQQSSTVGLDWLFSTDSDSSEEGEIHMRERYLSESSSSASNEGDSTFDTNPDNSPEVVKEEKEEGEVSKPVDENLEKMKKQGAIPKHYIRNPQPKEPSPIQEDTEAGTPSSGEMIDEDFKKKILEILDESSGNSEQMKRLVRAVIEKGRRGSSRERTSPREWRRKNSKAGDDPGDGTVKEEEGEVRSSKSTTPTENSALLPSQTVQDATGVRHRKLGRSRRRGQRKSKSRSQKEKDKHIAKSHDDTSQGAVHWFQDEKGQWFSYTFGDESGTATSTEVPTQETSGSFSYTSSPSSSESGSTVIYDDSIVNKPTDDDSRPQFFPSRMNIPGFVSPQDFQELLERGRQRLTTCDSSSDSDNFHSIKEEKPKQFYKFQILPKKFLKIRFDRLALLALLDRNLGILENLIAVIIAIIVGALGALVLSSNFYHDIFVFLFCFIIASCQYSLIKSVQPDAASPMHGYNRMVVFSRPFYFCLCCGLMLLLDYCQSRVPSSSLVYGTSTTVVASLQFGRDLLKVFILCFPILFTIGLLPQVNTFLMYLLEQIDMHIFGGNASVSLTSAVYCFVRSLIAVAILYGFCYVAVEVGDSTKACEDKNLAQNAVFSIFSGILVAISYHLSRSASDPTTLWMLIKDCTCPSITESTGEGELVDPLPGKLKKCVIERLQSDLLVGIAVGIIVFSVHISTVFSSPVLQPVLSDILYYMAASVGFLIHYVIPMLRKEMPWLCCSHPVLANRERNFFEVTVTPKIMWFEKMYVWFCFFERNMMYPVVFLCALTRSTPHIICNLGKYVGPLVLVICAMKLLRFSFSNAAKQFLVISFTVFYFKYDYRKAPDTFLVYFFIVSILMSKFCDLMLKMKFIITYIAPWQITWGSAFHAFAQPFSVPHSAMLFVQAGVSAVFSTPLNPFLGSAIFFTSYVRPIKFWEKDYNTKRVDHSNTKLSSQLERNPGADDNNLNSIFYEHLTRSLQHSLCGDLMLGRWGNAEQGDCFIMASDYLNALVHVIEMGNGLVTFQLRGLEFRGTYCQQREVEAITEGVEDNDGFCCCEPGHLPHFLSLNAAFNQRWLAWEVVVTKYVLEGYSISDNSAATMVHGFDTRKVLLNYYVMSIIYYTVRSPHLEAWLQLDSVVEHLNSTLDEDFVDVDPVFNMSTDEDYDGKLKGVSRNTFCNTYLQWIQYCSNRRQLASDSEKNSSLVSLCYCLSLLGRRALGTATHNNAATCGDFFLYGLHALFKGDFRITSPHDEWVFADMELLRRVVAPGIRMALKLHQDYYLFMEEYEDHETLYDAISNYEQNMVISHEADPQWRNAVLSNTPSLLALRHVFDVEGSDEYKIIMLNKKFLTFRVVKVNRECVRGLWAGQQQELIYLRNRNPERGSIQNAKQALRNMINSSCDQPIGYPIYVSPLTTSYSSTHTELSSIIGGEFIIANVKSFFKNLWVQMRRRCGATCAGSSSGFEESVPYSVSSCTHTGAANILGYTTRSTLSTPTNQQDLALQSLGNRGSLVSTTSSAGKPLTLVSLAGFKSESTSNKDTLSHRVRIMDPSLVFDNINLGRRIDVQWPNEEWRQSGGKNGWQGWIPTKGMEGAVVHKWIPCHRETIKRSHVDKVILLVQIGDRYVPVAEQGVLDLGAEV